MLIKGVFITCLLENFYYRPTQNDFHTFLSNHAERKVILLTKKKQLTKNTCTLNTIQGEEKKRNTL